jgi:hypothetical protein
MCPDESGVPTRTLGAVETRLRLAVEGRWWVLEQGQPALRFGRAPDNDLVLGDDFTSRHHGSANSTRSTS